MDPASRVSRIYRFCRFALTGSHFESPSFWTGTPSTLMRSDGGDERWKAKIGGPSDKRRGRTGRRQTDSETRKAMWRLWIVRRWKAGGRRSGRETWGTKRHTWVFRVLCPGMSGPELFIAPCAALRKVEASYFHTKVTAKRAAVLSVLSQILSQFFRKMKIRLVGCSLIKGLALLFVFAFLFCFVFSMPSFYLSLLIISFTWRNVT